MFETSATVQGMIDRLYQECLVLDRGDTLSHETIHRVLKLDPHVHPWDYVVERVRNRIQDERGIATWSSHGVGYRFLTDDEQLREVPRLRNLKARRQVRKGLKSVEALPVEGLSDHQQLARSRRLDQMRRTSREITADIRLISAMTNKPETLPRVKPRLLVQESQ